MSFASTILLAAALAAWACFLWSRRRYYKVALQLPGPWGLPFIGMGLQMLNPETFLDYMQQKSQHYSKGRRPLISWMGAQCFLYVNDPETMETIFNSPHCKNKGTFYRFMADAIGDGLFTSSASRWAKHRRLINPAFSRQVIQNFLPIFNAETDELLGKFAAAAASGVKLEIYETLKKSVLEMACQTTMGRKMKFQQNRSSFIFDAYNGLTEVIVRRMLTPWFYPACIYERSQLYARQQKVVNVLFGFVEHLLQTGGNKSGVTTTTAPVQPSVASTALSATRRSIAAAAEAGNVAGEDAELEQPKAGKSIFVEQVRSCVEQGQFTWQDVRDEANVIIAATFETTSTALYLVCLCLAMHPDYQEQLHAELSAELPRPYDGDELSAAQLDRLPFTEAVINEAMRLFAPVPIVLRRAAADFQLRCGVTIPRGTQLGLDIYNMQRSSAVWGAHAAEFRPDLHFGDDGLARRLSPFAFVPFTRGLRMCLGYRYALLLMKVMVAKVFLRYRLSTTVRLSDVRVKGTISLKLQDYPLCAVERR